MSSTHESPQIVVIGGGTGNFTVLTGLKPHVGEGLTAVVGMADDGGSTGVLRDELGVLPAGDIRQCLVALSGAPQETRDLINHRYEKGMSGLAGHTFGNILIATAQQEKGGDMIAALDMLGKILDIRGQVLPATTADRRLRLTTVDGKVIDGEHVIGESGIPSLMGATVGFDKEPTRLHPRADAAIRSADMVVIAPGDLYTSIAPALAVEGMREALVAARCVVQVTNLMNRDRHTKGFTVSDYANEVERIAGASILHYVLYNSEQPDGGMLTRYAGKGEHPVKVDGQVLAQAHYTAIGKELLSSTKVITNPSDALVKTRSLIRHDPQKVARGLLAIHARKIT